MGDCFAFAQCGSDGEGSLEMLLAVEALRYSLEPYEQRHISILLDAIFQKNESSGESYLVLAHPGDVEMHMVPDVLGDEEEMAGQSHSRLLERVYGDETISYSRESSDAALLDISCVHFPYPVKALYKRLEQNTGIQAISRHLALSHGESLEEDTFFTLAKVGPFLEKGAYGLRVAVLIEGPAFELAETAKGIFYVEGPSRLYAKLDEKLRDDAKVIDEHEDSIQALISPQKRRNPLRYDVLLLNHEYKLPHYTRLTANTAAIEPVDIDEPALVFSCADKRQEFMIQLNFNQELAAASGTQEREEPTPNVRAATG